MLCSVQKVLDSTWRTPTGDHSKPRWTKETSSNRVNQDEQGSKGDRGSRMASTTRGWGKVKSFHRKRPQPDCTEPTIGLALWDRDLSISILIYSHLPPSRVSYFEKVQKGRKMCLKKPKKTLFSSKTPFLRQKGSFMAFSVFLDPFLPKNAIFGKTKTY